MLAIDGTEIIIDPLAVVPQAQSQVSDVAVPSSNPSTVIISNKSGTTTTNSVKVAEGNKMADIVTGTVMGQLDITALQASHSDIRREQAEQASTIRRETAKEASDTNDIIKTSAWANSDRTGTEADRIVGQSTAYFIAQQQNDFGAATALAALKASADLSSQRLTLEIAASGDKAAAASALESAKVASAVALGQATMERSLLADGAATRELINRLKYEDQNRYLMERNQELVACHSRSHDWEFRAGQNQFAVLQSQLQAFNSQLQDTKQSVVNFGSGAATGGAQSSNSVR